LKDSQIKRVEEIVYPVIKTMDYALVNKDVRYRPIGKMSLFGFKLSDGVKNVIFNIKDSGLSEGLNLSYKSLKIRV